MAKDWNISKLPNTPVVYALYAGNGPYVVYVGHTRTLRTRISQHLITCDSSINTVSAAARLNPDRINEVRWWESVEFIQNGEAQSTHLKAAELVAFEILDPVLRSNASPEGEAKELSEQADFRLTMRKLFEGKAQGRLPRRDALAEIDKLSKRIEVLESRLGSTKT